MNHWVNPGDILLDISRTLHKPIRSFLGFDVIAQAIWSATCSALIFAHMTLLVMDVSTMGGQTSIT